MTEESYRMSQQQEAAWRELSDCPDCVAGFDPLPGSRHEKLWQVATVAWGRARKKFRRKDDGR